MSNITCGACKQQHSDPAQVRACYAAKYGGFGPVVDHLAAIEQLGRVDNLAELQASVDKHPSTISPALRPLPDGYFTIVFNEDDRITLRIRTQEQDSSFAPGKQVVAYLAGPDNTSNYKGFAFADPTSGRVNLWKKFKEHSRLTRAIEVLQQDPEFAGLTYAIQSGNCWMCGRLLTVPASIHRGLGPICARKVSR